MKWEALAEEAKAEAEALRDEIKAEMLERDTEELAAGRYIVRWTSVLSNRFDSNPAVHRKLLSAERHRPHGADLPHYDQRSAKGPRPRL